MNCPNCGSVNEEGAAFCFNCGTNLSQAQAATPAVASAPATQPQATVQPQAAAQPQVIINNNTPGMVPGMVYEVSGGNKTLRMVAFIFSLLRTIGVGWTLLPLAWHIPMCVHTWGIYKGRKANTVAFGVLSIFFNSLVAGILLLCARHDQKPGA